MSRRVARRRAASHNFVRGLTPHRPTTQPLAAWPALSPLPLGPAAPHSRTSASGCSRRGRSSGALS
eukprot:2220494-Prymnesium_polylepis.1